VQVCSVNTKFDTGIEVVAVDVLNVLNPVRFIVVYRSPTSDTDPSAVSNMKLLIVYVNCVMLTVLWLLLVT
jgi:hypothetical protein